MRYRNTFHIAAAFFLNCLILTVSNPLCPAQTAGGEEDVILIETNLIVSDVMVLDKNGNPVKGLKKDDFIVRENDEPQEIGVFLPGDTELFPRSIILLIDYSGSQLPYIDRSIEATKVLVDKLNPNDRMAIMTDDVKIVQDFTSDKELLKEKLEILRKKALTGSPGISQQYTALMEVLKMLSKQEQKRPIIIFQSDGDELFDLKGDLNDLSRQRENKKFSYKELLTECERSNATIYTIIPGLNFLAGADDEKMERVKTFYYEHEAAFASLRNVRVKRSKEKFSEEFLKQRVYLFNRQQAAVADISKMTGGTNEFLTQPADAEKIYSNILSDMNRRYLIGYYPINQARDGKMREVNINVRPDYGYTIVGKKYYRLGGAGK
jgi:VWFA-related protein